MKHDTRNSSKKNKPRDLKRVRNKQGIRVWVTGGKEFRTLREVPDIKKEG